MMSVPRSVPSVRPNGFGLRHARPEAHAGAAGGSDTSGRAVGFPLAARASCSKRGACTSPRSSPRAAHPIPVSASSRCKDQSLKHGPPPTRGRATEVPFRACGTLIPICDRRKRPLVGQLRDALVGGPVIVRPAGLDADQHRAVASLGSLKRRDELERVARHDAVVVVRRSDERAGVTGARLQVMQRRVLEDERELLGVGRGSVLGDPRLPPVKRS